MREGRRVEAVVALVIDEGGRVRVTTEPPGLVPEGADIETAMLSLGGALMSRLLDPSAGTPVRPRGRGWRSPGGGR